MLQFDCQRNSLSPPKKRANTVFCDIAFPRTLQHQAMVITLLIECLQSSRSATAAKIIHEVCGP